MRIAYLVSQYPAASHTFIRREITALRAKGVKIHTFSIREPSPAERVSPIDKEAFESTFYALPPKLGNGIALTGTNACKVSAEEGQAFRPPVAVAGSVGEVSGFRLPPE